MRAAEKLIAAKGIKNVSIKEIVSEAGQKNESALQYHFKSLQGLIDAITVFRSQEIQQMRQKLFSDLPDNPESLSLRDACKIVVMPAFMLGRKSAEHRRFIVSFGHELALSPNALATASKHRAKDKIAKLTEDLLRSELAHLDDHTYQERLEAAIRLAAISMGHHARQKQAFKGPKSDLFLSNLIDAMVGLLNAPISAETTDLLKQTSK